MRVTKRASWCGADCRRVGRVLRGTEGAGEGIRLLDFQLGKMSLTHTAKCEVEPMKRAVLCYP